MKVACYFFFFFFFKIHKVLCLTHELNSVLTTQQQTQSDSSAKMVTDYYSIIRDVKQISYF